MEFNSGTNWAGADDKSYLGQTLVELCRELKTPRLCIELPSKKIFLLAVSLMRTAIGMVIGPRLETDHELAAEGALETGPDRATW
ncbi:hypothetical protein EYC80_006021 [Monilinia laxa]|uniref:Uncharacterized protein n=1 Tax=Monilinia laxa TaxID=61186 RepID=A0A5N6KG35_MONLA|nr:hypothetical protein EYC80_006021 [Monilinia laxa]